MPIYQVIEDRVEAKAIRTTNDLAEVMSLADIDLDELEAELITVDQVEVPIVHHFAPGVYIREARFSKGSFVIGHRHRCSHLNVMLEGHLTLANGLDVTAPTMFVGGDTRKAAVMHTDCVWLNIYATDEQDVGKLEDMFMIKSQAALDQERAHVETITQFVIDAREDYLRVVAEIGFTPDELAERTGVGVSKIPLPWGAYKFRTAPSPIHGDGIFASAGIAEGEKIGPAHIKGECTVLGHLVNHSNTPNAKLVPSRFGFDLVAIRDIGGNRGGQFGEEITTDYKASREAVLCAAQFQRQ